MGRSSICWRGRREFDNGRQKTRNHGYDVIVGGELFTDYSDHPRKLVTLNPNSNQQAPDATSFFPVGGMPTASSLAWKTSSRKVVVDALWHCSRLRSVALYLYDWSWWYLVVAPWPQQYLGFPLPGAGYGQPEHKAISICKNSKKRAERSERLMCWAESPRLSPLCLACIITRFLFAAEHH